jgi:hypothetical protein
MGFIAGGCARACRSWMALGTSSNGSAPAQIHDLKTAEIKIRRLNRVYAVLSGINALIVRVTDRDAFFSEACRIAVEEGGFRMSVMCLFDQSTMSLNAVASASKDNELFALVMPRHVADSRASIKDTARRGRSKTLAILRPSLIPWSLRLLGESKSARASPV